VGSQQLTEATRVFEEALALWEDLGLAERASEPLAGLAQIALTQGDLGRAQELVERTLANVTGFEALCEAWEPFQIYLTCVRVLRALHDARADVVLSRSHQELIAHAAKISNRALRQKYLEDIPAHNEIVAEYGKLGPGDASG
jgi:hypothetical protein